MRGAGLQSCVVAANAWMDVELAKKTPYNFCRKNRNIPLLGTPAFPVRAIRRRSGPEPYKPSLVREDRPIADSSLGTHSSFECCDHVRPTREKWHQWWNQIFLARSFDGRVQVTNDMRRSSDAFQNWRWHYATGAR